jgi:soluble lytic murein transglycosylase
VCLLASVAIAVASPDAFAKDSQDKGSAHSEAAADGHKHGKKPDKKSEKKSEKKTESKKTAAESKKSAANGKKTAAGRHGKHHDEAREKAHGTGPGVPVPMERPDVDEAVVALPPDLAATKQAIALVRRGKIADAALVASATGDPVERKLVEWALLRSDTDVGFDRYAAFIRANPAWPSMQQLRRRAEARLWQDRRDAATVRSFFGGDEPSSALGRLALARALISTGDRDGGDRQVRAAWQSGALSPELENTVLKVFGDELTQDDNMVRMDWRLTAKDFTAAMRTAKRLGDDEVAIVKACDAVDDNSSKAGSLLDAVPSGVRDDLGYTLCRLRWLMRKDDVAAAGKMMAGVSHDDLQRQDTDEWWRMIRLLARRLIDQGDTDTAYRIVRIAALPDNPYYRAEVHFLAGWIALRFQNDPTAAMQHFAHVDEDLADPIIRARAAYWRGRAAEAAGQVREMRTQYEAAARYPTAYYGQLARARLGLGEFELRPPPQAPLSDSASEVAHAVDVLYSIGERDLVASFVNDLANESSDGALLAAIGQLTAQYNDARAMLIVGKTALAKGLPMDQYAFPDIGVPTFSPLGPELDRCIVYSIVRTESAFDQRDMSPAKAVGLMQVTPEAGRDTAKRVGAAYDWNKLVSDPVYNAQMGSAEAAALLKEYRGSYIMTFAGYNAGRGRVRQWVAQHGDPRDPNVDAVDWVERIPIPETRNYVQRVMENLQVYRVRFGSSASTLEPNLHRGPAAESSAAPFSFEHFFPH